MCSCLGQFLKFNPKSKQHKVKVTNLKKLPKIIILKFCKKTLQTTHLLKLLDKMHKYEMDPTRIIWPTERTQDVGRTDGQRDGQTDVLTDGQTD